MSINHEKCNYIYNEKNTLIYYFNYVLCNKVVLHYKIIYKFQLTTWSVIVRNGVELI